MAAVASRPSISGICTSMRTRSNGLLVEEGQHLAPVGRRRSARGPRCSRRPEATCWFTGLSSATSTRRARAPAPPSGRGRARAPSAAGRRREHRHDRVHEVRLLHGLRQVRRDPELDAASAVAGPRARGEHHDRRRRRGAGGGWIALGEPEPVHARACWRRGARAGRAARVARPAPSRRAPPAPLATARGRMRQCVSISSRMRRLVALSSTTSTRRPRRFAGGGRGRPARRARARRSGR